MHQASPEQAMLIYDDLAGPAKKAPVVPNAYTQSQQDAIAKNFGIKPKSGSSTKPMTITTVTGQKSDTSAKRTISQVQEKGKRSSTTMGSTLVLVPLLSRDRSWVSLPNSSSQVLALSLAMDAWVVVVLVLAFLQDSLLYLMTLSVWYSHITYEP